GDGVTNRVEVAMTIAIQEKRRNRTPTSVPQRYGPADHGRLMTLKQFETGRYREGFQYELIDGRLYVSTLPDPPYGIIELWVFFKLQAYWQSHRDVLQFVSNKTRVFVPRRRRATTPEPDVAAYGLFPLHLPFKRIRWQDVSPILVVEVLSESDANKD